MKKTFYTVALPYNIMPFPEGVYVCVEINDTSVGVSLPNVPEVVDPYDWLIDNEYLHALINYCPAFATDQHETGWSTFGQGLLVESIWRFTDSDIAMLFKLTFGGK